MRSRILLLFVFLSHLAFSQWNQFESDSLAINQLNFNVYSTGINLPLKETASGKSLVFSSGLWLSGNDSSIQQRGSFHDYANGPAGDWQCGPISTNPNAFATYNKVWKINKTTVDSFAAGYFGTIAPQSIASWPAHGNTAFGESYYLAPFVDVNGNGHYNPSTDGDYPCFPGDQAIFFMFNDDTTHATSGASPLGVEILGLAYAYQQASFLDSVVFVSYTVRNKQRNFQQFRAALQADFDLGNAIDDLVGSFVDQNAVFAYNGDGNDEGPLGFGLNPPATGIVVLNGLPDFWYDFLDNDKDGCIDGVRNANGICQVIDSANNIIEYWKLSNSMYYNNTSNALTGNPSTLFDHIRYMSSRWKDGSHLAVENPSGYLNTANGDGYVASGGFPSTSIYPGNSYDTSGAFMPNAPVNWFESPANAEDKRVVIGTGVLDTLLVNTEMQIKLAYFYARDVNSLNSFDAAYEMTKKINAFVDSVPTCSGSRLIAIDEEQQSEEKLAIYPNPAQDWVLVSAPDAKEKQGKILSLDGRILTTFTLDDVGKATVKRSHLPAGMYLVMVGESVKKLIVQ